jgi:hypothetical protein
MDLSNPIDNRADRAMEIVTEEGDSSVVRHMATYEYVPMSPSLSLCRSTRRLRSRCLRLPR